MNSFEAHRELIGELTQKRKIVSVLELLLTSFCLFGAFPEPYRSKNFQIFAIKHVIFVCRSPCEKYIRCWEGIGNVSSSAFVHRRRKNRFWRREGWAVKYSQKNFKTRPAWDGEQTCEAFTRRKRQDVHLNREFPQFDPRGDFCAVDTWSITNQSTRLSINYFPHRNLS